MHDIENKAGVVGHIDAPILIGPNLCGVVLQNLTNELRGFNTEGGMILGFNRKAVPDAILGTKLDLVRATSDPFSCAQTRLGGATPVTYLSFLEIGLCSPACPHAPDRHLWKNSCE